MNFDATSNARLCDFVLVAGGGMITLLSLQIMRWMLND